MRLTGDFTASSSGITGLVRAGLGRSLLNWWGQMVIPNQAEWVVSFRWVGIDTFEATKRGFK